MKITTPPVARARKRRDIRFTPTPPNGRIDFRLEPRVLARPAFFQNPAVSPQPLVTTTAAGGGAASATNFATSTGQVVATATGWFGPSVTFMQLGTSTSMIDDLPNPGGGNSVGTDTIAMNFTHLHQYSISSNPANLTPDGGIPIMTTTAAGGRSYLLGDDGTAPAGGPTALVETVHFSLATVGPLNALIGGTMFFTGVGFSIGATYPMPPTVGTVTPGSTVTASSSFVGGLATFDLTATTPFPAGLPAAPGGIPVAIAYGSVLTTVIPNGSDESGQTQISFHYDAHFT